MFSLMAGRIGAIVATGSDWHAGKIVVTDKSGGASTRSPMEIALANDIATLDGVAVAVPGVSTLLDPESTAGRACPTWSSENCPAPIAWVWEAEV